MDAIVDVDVGRNCSAKPPRIWTRVVQMLSKMCRRTAQPVHVHDCVHGYVQNGICAVRWWTNVLGKLERSEHFQGVKDPLFPQLYEQLNRSLGEGSGSVALYQREMKKLHQLAEQRRSARAVPAPEPKKRKRR